MRFSGITNLIVASTVLAACSADNQSESNVMEPVATEDAIAEDAAEPAEESAIAQPRPAAPVEIEGIENRRVSFEAGASSATVEGSITGYEVVDYLLNVREGQAMNVSMATQNTASYFNILEPGETDVAIHVGSTSGNQFEGMTAKSGDYRIRVYMMRSAARRDETANYRLEMFVS